ncbi:Tripartite tricarboxylate transporter family receptor [compost metagenome]
MVLRINDGFAKALRTPEITRRLTEMAVVVEAGSPEDLARLMPQEIKKWGALVKASGAKAQ